MSHVVYNGELTLPKSAIIYCKGEYVDTCLGVMHDDGKYILISGFGDASVTYSQVPKIKDSLKYWYANNVIAIHPKIIPIPYGLSTAYEHGLKEQEDCLEEVLKVERYHKNSVLISHTIPIKEFEYYKERVSSIETLKEKSYCDIMLNIPMLDVYKNMRNHDYMISTIGLGYDCMRTWECIYTGCIPICKRHPFNSSFTDMPIAFVDDWNDVTETWCEHNLNIVENNKERAYFDYWEEQIKEKAKRWSI